MSNSFASSMRSCSCQGSPTVYRMYALTTAMCQGSPTVLAKCVQKVYWDQLMSPPSFTQTLPWKGSWLVPYRSLEQDSVDVEVCILKSGGLYRERPRISPLHFSIVYIKQPHTLYHLIMYTLYITWSHNNLPEVS